LTTVEELSPCVRACIQNPNCWYNAVPRTDGVPEEFAEKPQYFCPLATAAANQNKFGGIQDGGQTGLSDDQWKRFSKATQAQIEDDYKCPHASVLKAYIKNLRPEQDDSRLDP